MRRQKNAFLEPREVNFTPEEVGRAVLQALEDSVCAFPNATELPEEPTMTLRKYRRARSWKAAYKGLATCSVYRHRETLKLYRSRPAPDGRGFWGDGESEVFTAVEELGQRVVDALRESERHP